MMSKDPDDVRGLWPTGAAGRVLVTTRRRDPAMVGHGRSVVDVAVFTPAEATQFLTRKLDNSPVPGVLNGAQGLAEDLGRLPLALAQAGAVIPRCLKSIGPARMLRCRIQSGPRRR